MERVIADDGTDMGTKEEAEARLLRSWTEWCKYQQPHIDSAAGHKKRELLAREAQNRLAQDAAFLAWHISHEREDRDGE